MLIHATCVALAETGLLLRGPPGAGKSDLALRLILSHGARLVADDCCLLSQRPAADGPSLWVCAPKTIAGLMEVRGVGLFRPPSAAEIRLRAVIDLIDEPPERLPDPAWIRFFDVQIPVWRLRPFEASAAAKAVVVSQLAAQSLDADSVVALA